ncbi:GH25 family lysozyme [Neobacillus sp. C211]|uniref:GH25 family lysozyme n=1 Tax=unclassified Neobacillus TaxID=2675272 RepID=UPI0039780E20
MVMKARASTDLQGADISSWQTITNPQQFFTDFKFVYIRAYGSDGLADSKFIEYVNLAKQYGVPSGGYYFARPTPNADLKTDAEAQAQKFIDKLQEAYGTGQFGDLIPMLDVEEYRGTLAQNPPTLEVLRDNAFYLTSLMETSTYREDFPHMHGVTSGNFDGAGVSHGAIQWNFKSNSLQPILKDLINNHNDLVRGIFGIDYDEFYDVVFNRTTANQIAWGAEITNPNNKHELLPPWNDYFYRLGTSPEGIQRQKDATIDYHNQAKKLFDQFKLWTRRGYALCFDIAVQSWAPNATATTNINNDIAALNEASMSAEEYEHQKLVIIANRTADTIDISWRESYRERKLAMANGSGTVYGSLLVDTVPYDMILEPAFTARNEEVMGFPYAWGMTGTQLKDWILYFRNYFRSKSKYRALGIYTNRWFLTDADKMAMTTEDLAALYNSSVAIPLWLADWNQTEGYTPANLGNWTEYALWQYGVIDDASTHGVQHGSNQLDHDSTQSLALIMPPKPASDIQVTQKDNSTITVSFTPPDDSDYIGSDVLVDGVWKKWAAKGTNAVDIAVTTPIGGVLNVQVNTQDKYQDSTWGPNVSYTMKDTTVPIVEADQVINFVGRAAGDESRKIMVNGLAGTEIAPTSFGAEWWNYPGIVADDGSLMTYTISPNNGANNGDHIQYLFQFEVTADPTPAEELVFRVKGVQGQPFSLKFWDHVAGAWDELTKVTFNGGVSQYVEIRSTNLARHKGANNRVYISMFSTNAVVDPAIAVSKRNYPINWLSAWRQTTSEIISTLTPLYAGGASGLASFIGIDRAEIIDSLNKSRSTPKVYINFNGTVAGFGRLGFHNEAAQKTTAGIPTLTGSDLTINSVVGWNRWDVTNAVVGTNSGFKNVLITGGFQGLVIYANANEGTTITAYGATGDANEIYLEIEGDWQATSGVTLGADYAELLIYRGEPVPEAPPKPEPVAQPPDHLTYDYTEEDIQNMLHAKTGSRFLMFRYDLLDVNENKIRELRNVVSGSVQMSALSTIKRTARFRIKEDPNEPINFLNNRIQPWAMFKLPDKFVQNADGTRVLLEGKWIEYPLGVYLLSSPKKSEVGNDVFRDIEAYDGIVILEEDKFINRYTVRAGTKYTQAIIEILQGAGITKYNIGASDRVLPNDVEYEPGTEKTKPISDFLTAINFTALYVDEYGYFTAQPYVSPSDRNPNYRYIEDQFSVVQNGVEEELDLYSVPNSWAAIYTSVDSTSENQIALISNYTNTNPDSPTSTVNRGRTIVDYRKVNEIADQAALDQYVQRIAFEASQIFGKVTFETAIMPFHGFQDVIYLENKTLGIAGKYAETAWSFDLQAGASMKHEVRAVINI